MNTELLKQEMAETIQRYHNKGWSPATSTNYSFKDEENQIWVSRSGVDKSIFSADDFIQIDAFGVPQGKYQDIKPSAETMIHVVLFRLFPECKVILHSHGPYPVLLSTKQKSFLKFEGYEVQKGFDGVTTHESEVLIPIFDNSQDMAYFEYELEYRKNELNNHAFVIRKHGTYAWGKSLFEAKRHLETLDYLAECEFLLNK